MAVIDRIIMKGRHVIIPKILKIQGTRSTPCQSHGNIKNQSHGKRKNQTPGMQNLYTGLI